jgi:hypothetical protein
MGLGGSAGMVLPCPSSLYSAGVDVRYGTAIADDNMTLTRIFMSYAYSSLNRATLSSYNIQYLQAFVFAWLKDDFKPFLSTSSAQFSLTDFFRTFICPSRKVSSFLALILFLLYPDDIIVLLPLEVWER